MCRIARSADQLWSFVAGWDGHMLTYSNVERFYHSGLAGLRFTY